MPQPRCVTVSLASDASAAASNPIGAHAPALAPALAPPLAQPSAATLVDDVASSWRGATQTVSTSHASTSHASTSHADASGRAAERDAPPEAIAPLACEPTPNQPEPAVSASASSSSLSSAQPALELSHADLSALCRAPSAREQQLEREMNALRAFSATDRLAADRLGGTANPERAVAVSLAANAASSNAASTNAASGAVPCDATGSTLVVSRSTSCAGSSPSSPPYASPPSAVGHRPSAVCWGRARQGAVVNHRRCPTIVSELRRKNTYH